MVRTVLLAGAALLTMGAAPAPDPEMVTAVKAVSEAELKASITTLVGFGTRHTLSDRASPTRGIGAAERWAASRFEAIGRDCGGCLFVSVQRDTFTNARVPKPTEVGTILAVQRGTSDPDRVIVISGHIDSRNSDALDGVNDAPGANDDGSGTAAVLEAARVLSKHKFAATIVYAVDEGEEQGLLGAKVAAAYAKKQGWRVEADLNNDIVGNTHGSSGAVVTDRVRVFSEGTRTLETAAEAKQRRYNGGEVDSPSRNVARYMSGIAERYTPGFGVTMVYRTDRFGRGGDQTEFLNAGFPAVRITEAAEHYDRQHQTVRTENGRAYGDVLSGVDFPYLARVTRLNVATAASLAKAPAPPGSVLIEGQVSPDTTLSWDPVPGAARYRVWWRSTTSPRWEHSADTEGVRMTLKGVVIDDWFFGVSAVAADGSESPVVYPGPAGAFVPTTVTE
jgi:hypothetical protein